MKFATLTIAMLVFASAASAHPLSQGGLIVKIDAQKVSIKAQVTVEEVTVTNTYTGDSPLPGPFGAAGTGAFEKHAAYLAEHIQVIADGVARIGRVVSVTPPEDVAAKTVNAVAVYEIEYPLDPAAPTKQVQLLSAVLNDAHFPPGVTWETSYVVRITQAGADADGMFLLTGTQPILVGVDHPAVFSTFLKHGIHHILTGYDHLLFISALVLAAATLWDLVKVVTAFTLAHTITLTLAALNLVHVSERIVEPLIAASIVFVAVQNVLWPRASRGWTRLGAAFFFGLFHGLGFAGGLLDAMQALSGAGVTLAILAFSLGVEIGHQMVVLPLFAAIRIARRTRPDELSREKLRHFVRRFGSAGITLAGMYYLVFALWESFGAG